MKTRTKKRIEKIAVTLLTLTFIFNLAFTVVSFAEAEGVTEISLYTVVDDGRGTEALSDEKKLTIKTDYLTFLRNNNPSVYANNEPGDFVIDEYDGQYNGYDIIIISLANQFISDVVLEVEIADYTFFFSNEAKFDFFFAYKDGIFTPVKDAYEAGYITSNDVKDIAYFGGYVNAAELCDAGLFNYTIKNNEAKITGLTDTSYSGVLVLPSALGGCPVTTLNAFSIPSDSGITAIHLPASLTTISPFTIERAESLEAIGVDGNNTVFSSVNGVLFSKDKTILKLYPMAKKGTSYAIPSGVTKIESSAFFWCKSPVTITVPASVTEIASTAFCECLSLTEINVDEGNAVYCSVNGIVYSKDKTQIVNYPYAKDDNYFVLPVSVTDIGEYAFKNNESLKSVTLPAGLTTIGALSFYGCTALNELALPEGLTSIGTNCFSFCNKLWRLIVPDSVTSIGNGGISSATSVCANPGSYAYDYAKANGLTIRYKVYADGVATDFNSAINGLASGSISVLTIPERVDISATFFALPSGGELVINAGAVFDISKITGASGAIISDSNTGTVYGWRTMLSRWEERNPEVGIASANCQYGAEQSSINITAAIDGSSVSEKITEIGVIFIPKAALATENGGQGDLDGDGDRTNADLTAAYLENKYAACGSMSVSIGASGQSYYSASLLTAAENTTIVCGWYVKYQVGDAQTESIFFPSSTTASNIKPSDFA